MQGMWVVCTTRKLCDFSYNVMTYIAGPYLEVYAERTIYYLHGGVQDVTHKKNRALCMQPGDSIVQPMSGSLNQRIDIYDCLHWFVALQDD